MYLTTAYIILATVAGLVASSPAPIPDAVLKELPNKVAAPLAKRTDHYGLGTVYTQDGGIGSCGQAHSDYDYICALGNYWQLNESPGPKCGRTITATNQGSNDGVGGAGNQVTVLVADTCPSCDENHIDFSVGAWNALTNNAPFGTIDIKWNFNA